MQMLKLHAAVAQAIIDHHLASDGRLPRSQQGRFNWTLGPGVQRLKGVRNVDAVFFRLPSRQL
jgi:hypothetical protein